MMRMFTLFSALMIGGAAVADAADEATDSKDEVLILEARNGGGFAGPSMGLKVWEGGRYELWRRGPKGTTAGQMTAEQIKSLMKKLDEAGFFEAKDTDQHPNVPYIHIRAAHGDQRNAARLAENSKPAVVIYELVRSLEQQDQRETRRGASSPALATSVR